MTERRLVLVRHAKTEQGAPDRERRLTDRGRRDARELGRWLAAHGVAPDLAVVSPATRAAQTWELAAAELAEAPPVKVDERVYDNTVGDLVAIAATSDEDVHCLVVVGHNPSIEAFVATSTGRDDHVRTGSVAVLQVTGNWRDLSAATTVLSDLATCRG